jgi:hypothetical protein
MDGVARLPDSERAALFEETAARRRLANAGIVEKDFWVCWALHRLYRIPGGPRLLFKGGTSLSKCFGLIHRFSEDIDLGIRREDAGLIGDLDPMAQNSRKGYQNAFKAMKAKLHEYVTDTLFPLLEVDFREVLGDGGVLHRPELDAEEPSIRFEYPRALVAANYRADVYIPSVVRLELGARSDHEPTREVAIRPYAAEEFASEFQEPACNVVAQAPERTLLEKSLILHAAIHRGSLKRESSRHAYDLAMLHRDPGTMAAVDRGLYERVAHHKFVFGDNKKVADAPKEGIRLVPEGDLLRELEADYGRMQPMFFAWPAAPAFQDILGELTQLETALRAL